MEPFCRLGMVQAQFGVMRVQGLSGGLYQPDPEGVSSVIMPVVTPEYHDGVFGEAIILRPIVDLIAFQTNAPARWLWRTGNAWALGSHLLAGPTGEPTHIVATPLEWMNAGGDAVCLLDWSDQSPAWAYLRTVPDLIVDNDMLAARLAAGIDRATPRPRFIREARNAA